ncbi:Polyadenylate-binding protein 4 [Cichlidogyrus casuarinus]|uniref:Polyadenylate-binding protein n=1 Tax=Cichlidogyrus casuarinus TaxID=1844966 RepID=A0ABD2QMV3_9PLAT
MSASTDAPQMKSTSLYVGDLHPLVSDALLFTKFSEVGPVVNARVCRDMVSRDSLCYGYVNFRDPKDAEQALEVMNYTSLLSRPLRLMWSQKDPTLRKSGKGNIFIKNLDKSITSSELYDTFEQFGKILSCKLAIDDKGNSKGFGFVHYETEESAQKAIAYVNGKEIRNRLLYVGPFISKSERKSTGGAAKFNNCYVKNFGEDMDDERFKKLFEKYGEIKSACVMRNDQGVSKGFGFVCFEDPSAADAAVKEMDGSEINGKPVYVGRAQRKEERQEELKAKYEKQRNERQSRYAVGVNLYVKNLDDSIDDEKLHDAFSRFGDITSAKVMRDANGMSRSFGFVCFRTAEHATLAVTNMNTAMLGNKPLYVAIAQRKEDRRAKLTADYQARMESLRNQMYTMHPTLPFLPATAPAASYQANRAFYSRQYQNSAPRWQQAMVPNVPLAGAQPYQAGLAAQAGGQPMTQLMQLRGNPTGGAGLSARVGGSGLTGQMNNMSQYGRQNQARQMPTTGAVNPASAAIQNRGAGTGPVNMSMMQNRTQMGGLPQQQAQQAVRRVQQPTAAAQSQQKEEDDSHQRNILGNRLYEYVHNVFPEHAAKLTGMILSMPLNDVASMFDDPKELELAVKNANNMLQEKLANQPGKGAKEGQQ